MQIMQTKSMIEDVMTTDITSPQHVEVAISADRRTLWLNVNGECLFRACRIHHLTVDDKAAPQTQEFGDVERPKG